MQRSHVLGMICGYFLSRFDRRAYERLGYPNQQAAHDALGAALDVPSESIKNWRDEFDPVHDNPRRGWHRREMNPSRRRTIEALGDRSEDELYGLVMAVMADPAGRSRSLGEAGRAAQRASDILGPGLQDARRDVTRARALMRQRGRERDHGPSR